MEYLAPDEATTRLEVTCLVDVKRRLVDDEVWPVARSNTHVAMLMGHLEGSVRGVLARLRISKFSSAVMASRQLGTCLAASWAGEVDMRRPGMAYAPGSSSHFIDAAHRSLLWMVSLYLFIVAACSRMGTAS